MPGIEIGTFCKHKVCHALIRLFLLWGGANSGGIQAFVFSATFQLPRSIDLWYTSEADCQFGVCFLARWPCKRRHTTPSSPSPPNPRCMILSSGKTSACTSSFSPLLQSVGCGKRRRWGTALEMRKSASRTDCLVSHWYLAYAEESVSLCFSPCGEFSPTLLLSFLLQSETRKFAKFHFKVFVTKKLEF